MVVLDHNGRVVLYEWQLSPCFLAGQPASLRPDDKMGPEDRSSHPGIPMMQPANLRDGNHLAVFRQFDQPRDRAVASEAQMRAGRVIIVEIRLHNPPQVPFAEYDKPVKALAPQRAKGPLDVRFCQGELGAVSTYNAAGWLQDVTDPRGLVTRTTYDNLSLVIGDVPCYRSIPTDSACQPNHFGAIWASERYYTCEKTDFHHPRGKRSDPITGQGEWLSYLRYENSRPEPI